MSKYKTVFGLAAFAAAVTMGSSAHAADQSVNNWQYNWGAVFSQIYLDATWVGGDLRASSIAIGNNFTASTEGSTRILTQQYQLADVGAKVNATIHDAGSVDIMAAGICNNASISGTNSPATSIDNVQRCMTTDPYALANVTAGGVGGDLGVNATAIANNLTVDTEAATSWLGNNQSNPANVYAQVNAVVGNVGGAVNITAAAIGNNASFTQRFGSN